MFHLNRKISLKPQGALRWLFSAVALSAITTGSVAAAPPDTMPIWRVQVRFITADVGDAGTDSTVWIQLNDNNKTYLDSGRDDRERGKDETYELRLDGVNTLADIDYFKIQKNGDDGWAIRRMQLIVNNVAIYDESFPSSPLWLDNEDGHSRIRFTDDMFMRPRSNWVNYTVPTRPSIVPIAATHARVQGLYGDWANNGDTSNLGFKEVGDSAVGINSISLDTWSVQVQLDEVDTFLIGQDIDVDFKLKIGCVNGRPDFTVSNVNASSAFEPYTDSERKSARKFVNGDFKTRLNEMMKGFRYVPFCPSIALAPNGDIYFSSRFPVGDFGNLTFATASLLDVNVQTGDGIKPFAPANFVATVMSTLEKDTKAELVFELPPQVVAYDTLVEARPVPVRSSEPRKETSSTTTKGEYRKIDAKLDQRGDGTSALIFSDALAAGQNVEYTLHLYYQPKEDGEAQIVTSIQPLDDFQKLITPVKSTTYFSFQKGEVFPEGTSTTASHYVGEEPTWTKPKPADGK